jgi:hypothetical protein
VIVNVMTSTLTTGTRTLSIRLMPACGSATATPIARE